MNKISPFTPEPALLGMPVKSEKSNVSEKSAFNWLKMGVAVQIIVISKVKSLVTVVASAYSTVTVTVTVSTPPM